MNNPYENMNNFTAKMTALTGRTIGLGNVHPSSHGRWNYIQPPLEGAPMILSHYCGCVVIDIHPSDYDNIYSGEVSADDYICRANWQIGYYFGGGSIFSGGYYQPIDILKHSEEAKRYLQILSCRGRRVASGYMPKAEQCLNCTVDNCPFSPYKDGLWDNELQEYDGRIDFFRLLKERFENRYHAYVLGNLSSWEIADNEIWLRPATRHNSMPISFTAYAPNSIIRSILMRRLEPSKKLVNGFHFRLVTNWAKGETVELKLESIVRVFEEINCNARYEKEKKAFFPILR